MVENKFNDDLDEVEGLIGDLKSSLSRQDYSGALRATQDALDLLTRIEDQVRRTKKENHG